MNSLALRPALRRIFLEAFILCVLSIAVGLSLNFKLILNAFSGKIISPPVYSSPAPEKAVIENLEASPLFPMPVSLDELDDLLASGAVLIDARSVLSFQQEHLAGALSLPFATLDSSLMAFKQQVSFEKTLITYCSGYGCSDSFDLGERLLKEGYIDVLVYEGGLPEWQSVGRPLEGAGQ